MNNKKLELAAMIEKERAKLDAAVQAGVGDEKAYMQSRKLDELIEKYYEPQ